MKDYTALRLLAQMFQDEQDFRKAQDSKIRSGDVDADPAGPAVFALASKLHADAEHQIALAMRREYRKLAGPAVRRWERESPGVGEHLVARLLGVVGDPYVASPHHVEPNPAYDPAKGKGRDNPKTVQVPDEPYVRTVGQLRAYCGHGDPARKRAAGMAQAEAFGLGSPQAKMIVWNMAVACLKANKGPYRAVYDEARARYEQRDWTDGHRHAAALRKVGKEILLDLWLAAREDHGRAADEP